jgi:undecaprenyl-phosphate galactose phosphotransferase
MMAAYVFVTKTSLAYSRAMVVLIFLNMAWLLPLLRIVSKKVLNLFGTWQIPALVIGKSEQVERLRKDLEANWYLGYRPVDELGWGGVVFIMTKGMSTERIEKLIADYKNRLYGVVVIPYLGNLSFANADIVDLRIGQISMINIQNQLSRPRNILLKRTAEFLAVLAVLPLGIVIYAVVSIWIKLDSRGPVLFRQKRLGRHGEPFECYKFRTMYLESESLLENYLETYPEEREHYTLFHKYRHDPRITRAGRWLRKTSLDELPQLINILKGEMSLIGPRPYMLEEEEKLGNDAKTILYVRPGITGFWQIKGRNDLTFRERKDLDVWYIQNWSLWLDFVIFMKTFEVLLTRKGAR